MRVGEWRLSWKTKQLEFSDFRSGIISRRCKTRVGAWKQVGRKETGSEGHERRGRKRIGLWNRWVAHLDTEIPSCGLELE